MTPGEQERLKALEVRADFYDRILDRMDRSLEQNGTALKTLVRLEERHQSLDKATANIAQTLQSEIVSRKQVEDSLFARVRELEGDGGLSNHFRINVERVILIVAGALAGTAILSALQSAGAA